MTTTLDPKEVLRDYDDIKSLRESTISPPLDDIAHELAAALRETLSDLECEKAGRATARAATAYAIEQRDELRAENKRLHDLHYERTKLTTQMITERDELRAENEKLERERGEYRNLAHDGIIETTELRAKLAKAEAVVAAGRELVNESCIFYGRMRQALAAYDKEPA